MWKAGGVALKDGRPDFGGQTACSTLDCVLVNRMLLDPPAPSTWRGLRREAPPIPVPAKLHCSTGPMPKTEMAEPASATIAATRNAK